MGDNVPDVRMMEWAPRRPVNAYNYRDKGAKYTERIVVERIQRQCVCNEGGGRRVCNEGGGRRV